MPEEIGSSSEQLKAIRDKVSELEDTQLVNKLDIINMKNEIDKISLGTGPSPDTADKLKDLAKKLEKSDVLQKMQDSQARLEKLRAEIDKARPLDAKAVRLELDTLKKKIADLESMPAGESGGAGGMPADLEADIKDLKGRVTDLESRPAAKPGQAGKAEDSKLSADIASFKATVEELTAKVSKLESGPGKAASVPDDLAKRLDELSSSFDSQKKEITGLKHEVQVVGALRGEPGKASVRKVVADLEKKIQKWQAPPAKDTGASAAKADIKAVKDSVEKELEEIRQDVQVMSTSVPKGLPSPEKMNEMLKGFADMRLKLDQLEKSGSILEPEALSELRDLKGEFPVQEFAKLKERMAGLEDRLGKASKLAAALKPLDVPGGMSGQGKVPHELISRIKSIEKAVGEGASPKKVSELEDRVNDLKARIADDIGKDTQKQIADFTQKVEGKMSELQSLKQELVESALEQLLAQPGNVSRLIDKRLSSEVEELRNQIGRMGQQVSPADSKLMALMKDSDEKDREIGKLKTALAETREALKQDIEELEIDLKAATSKLGTVHTSVKGMEGAGVAGVMRDLEILKTKTDWLESTVHKIDLKPVYEKLEELEKSVVQSSGYSPMVIE